MDNAKIDQIEEGLEDPTSFSERKSSIARVCESHQARGELERTQKQLNKSARDIETLMDLIHNKLGPEEMEAARTMVKDGNQTGRKDYRRMVTSAGNYSRESFMSRESFVPPRTGSLMTPVRNLPDERIVLVSYSFGSRSADTTVTQDLRGPRKTPGFFPPFFW